MLEARQNKGVVGRGNIIKEDEIHQPRVKKAQRDKPKGRRS